MTREEIKSFAKQLEDKLLSMEGIEDLTMSYLSVTLDDWNPDNKKYETKYSYRSFDLSLDKNNEIQTADSSEPFKCTMGCKSCEERGECNGDC